jgi:hypothetical protein
MRLYVDNGIGKGGPGIRYGYSDAPGFLHEVMEGTQAFKPGIPNRRLVEDGKLSSAITFCVEYGTPMVFLGPHQIPDHLGLQVGDLADVYLYSNLRDDDDDPGSEEQSAEEDSDNSEASSDDEEHTLRQALLPTRLAVAIDAVHCAIWNAQTARAMQTCPAVNVGKYTTRLSSSVSAQSSLLFRLHTHELVMLWLNSRAVYASPDCSPPNFTKVVLGVNIHMHTMATKRVHKWLDYITNERPSHRTSVLVSLVQNIAQRLQLADEQTAYMLTPFILSAWDLRSFYTEQAHKHLIDPRAQAACISIAYAPEITLALSEACISGVDQSVRDMLLEWGTRQVGARVAWDGAVSMRSDPSAPL